MDDTMRYPPGSVIEFTSGCYSDFRSAGLVVTIKECHLPPLAQQFWHEKRAEERAEAQEGRHHWGPDIDDFVSWLIVKEYAMPVAASSVHLGDYGEFEPTFGVRELKHEDQP